MIAIVTLAGCADSGGRSSKGTSAGGPPPAAPVEFDEETGAIDGSVMDDQANPISGVEIGMLPGNATTLSDNSGKFTFSKVEPGTYTLATNRLGFETATLAATVRKGEATKVDFTLTPVASSETYPLITSQRGLFGCGTSWRPGLPVVGFTGIAVCGVLGIQSAVNTSEYDRFLLEWTVPGSTNKGWTASVFEMQWESNQATGKGISMIWEVVGCPNVRSVRFGSVAGETPLRIQSDQPQILGIIDNSTTVTTDDCDDAPAPCTADECQIMSRVFSTAQTFGAAAAADVGVTFQQGFEQYMTSWFNGPAPEGYTALPTG